MRCSPRWRRRCKMSEAVRGGRRVRKDVDCDPRMESCLPMADRAVALHGVLHVDVGAELQVVGHLLGVVVLRMVK